MQQGSCPLVARYVCLRSVSSCSAWVCLGILGGSHGSSLGVRVPPASKHFGVSIFWVVPAHWVAMDTLPFGLKFAGPLPTLKGPVPKLVSISCCSCCESLRILADRTGSFSFCFSESLWIHADLHRSFCRGAAT